MKIKKKDYCKCKIYILFYFKYLKCIFIVLKNLNIYVEFLLFVFEIFIRYMLVFFMKYVWFCNEVKLFVIF